MSTLLQGPVGLFFSALISSTLLPGGSEALLAWLVAQASHPLWLLWLSATAGNVLGSVLTWGLGYWLARRYPLQALDKPQHQRAKRWLERYGPAGLLLAWLPLIGDPLCLMAGWLRLGFMASLVAITLGKALRYAVVIGVFG
ncbi:membrane protein YqaA with SNARE-associated domain [Marinobacterium halophilum]|uniref:Membrane protein YqaA with SNARE-associated domain n=1 Tax=Marinobacterium halophilum TaxID=267374 RepID=A0A2P8F289_9GAMM|nr:YqaA family protein [Marinobacterium halophilum]PSL15827.1 membrane protein YqaA with SNARE-associated domain [Marinobacterium halophilum]